jgi:hypothetical protein
MGHLDIQLLNSPTSPMLIRPKPPPGSASSWPATSSLSSSSCAHSRRPNKPSRGLFGGCIRGVRGGGGGSVHALCCLCCLCVVMGFAERAGASSRVWLDVFRFASSFPKKKKKKRKKKKTKHFFPVDWSTGWRFDSFPSSGKTFFDPVNFPASRSKKELEWEAGKGAGSNFVTFS